MAHFLPLLQPRQALEPIDDDDDIVYDGGFWYSPTAYILKWSIVGGIFLLLVIFVVVGYFHAQARMKKGLQPLRYHRWLVPRKQRMRFQPAYQNQYMAYPVNNNGVQDGYAMDGYAPPPPVYNRNYENAPDYMPPDGASKVNPDQGDYAASPPPGPPPVRHDDVPAYPAPVAGNSERERV